MTMRIVDEENEDDEDDSVMCLFWFGNSSTPLLLTPLHPWHL